MSAEFSFHLFPSALLTLHSFMDGLPGGCALPRCIKPHVKLFQASANFLGQVAQILPGVNPGAVVVAEVKTGGVVSTTVTVNNWVSVLPSISVAVMVNE